jgi:hypothetical protein
MSVGGIQGRPADFPLQSPPDPYATASGAANAQPATDSAAAATPPSSTAGTSTVSANKVDKTV